MAKRDRREYAREQRAKDPDKFRAMSRANYAKHREKRLAAKKASRDRDLEEARAYQRAQYAKHCETRVEDAREYRRRNKEAVNARAMEKARANKDVIAERRKGYRAKHYEKTYAKIREWAKQNPEKVRLHEAKTRLHETTGIARSDIPDDLAEAKALELEIGRWVRTGQEEPEIIAEIARLNSPSPGMIGGAG